MHLSQSRTVLSEVVAQTLAELGSLGRHLVQRDFCEFLGPFRLDYCGSSRGGLGAGCGFGGRILDTGSGQRGGPERSFEVAFGAHHFLVA